MLAGSPNARVMKEDQEIDRPSLVFHRGLALSLPKKDCVPLFDVYCITIWLSVARNSDVPFQFRWRQIV